MMLNEQGPSCHPLDDAPYLDLDTVLNVPRTIVIFQFCTNAFHVPVILSSKNVKSWPGRQLT
jgi:hypothetical protein